MTLPVTVVVPTRNEERNLARCLDALDGFAKIVVVDSGSTDGTRVIAKARGIEVVPFEWNGSYPKKRNWVLTTMRLPTEWVLFLDADELVTPAFREALQQVLVSTQHAGFWLNYTNHFLGQRLRHGVLQRKLALFRVGAGLYERIDEDRWSALDMEVHEHPILDGTLGEIAEPIEHNDFKSLHHFIDRHNHYSSWEARRTLALLHDTAGRSLTKRQRLKYRFVTKVWFAPAYFLLQYVVKLGCLDGRAGLLYAIFKYRYFADVRLKFHEEVQVQSRKVELS